MVAFVILHYKNIIDTIECLECIKNLNNQTDIQIVVVDNHTLNDQNLKKIKKYTKDVILLDENMGFAKANNIGCKYAKDKYNPDYYFVINNDVMIEQKDVLRKIDEAYKKYKFDMLGGKISSPTGESVNPFPALKTKKEVINEIARCQKLIKIYNCPFLTLLLFTYIKLKRIFIEPRVIENGKVDKINVPLHGCAIVFSKKYIDKYGNAFYDGTFLFHEEEFLYQRVLRDKQVSVYDTDIELFHKEGSSIKNNLKKYRKVKLFKETERLKSLELLLLNM